MDRLGSAWASRGRLVIAIDGSGKRRSERGLRVLI